MTTTTAPRVPAGHYRFRHAARMEWIKLRTLRYPVWALLFAVAGTVGAGIAAGINTKNPHGDATNNILAGITLAQIVIGVIGVLTMSGEYSSGMIRATLAAIPRRPLVLAAKAAVFGAVALAAGELGTFTAFQAGVTVLRSSVPHPALSQPAVLRAVALTGAYLCLIGLIGVALGAIIRHGAGAIATLIGVMFVLPGFGLAASPVGKFIPELIAANSLAAVQPVHGFTFSPWAGLGLICLYTGVLLGVAGWLLVRRDA